MEKLISDDKFRMYCRPFLLSLIIISSCTSLKKTGTTSYQSFEESEKSLVMNQGSNVPMRVFKITDQKDSILLRTKSQTVAADSTDEVLVRLIDRMYATVTDSSSMGVGIAAPQVGILKRVIWVQRLDKENFPFEAYINPKITEYSVEKQDCREGCLSIPSRRDTTKTRSKTIQIEYDMLDHQHYKESVEGFTAVIFQHEIDHLNGILYLDHLTEEANE